MKSKKNIIIIVLTFLIVLTCWIVFFQFGKYYQGYFKITAGVKTTKVKKVVPKEEKTNLRSGVEVYKLDNIQPGFFDPSKVERKDKKKVAYLTIDDGPSYNNTTKILNILKENNINATFFLIGQNAERYPQLVKQEVAEGNSVANHTYTHPLRYRMGAENFMNDVNKCDEIIKNIVGDKYVKKLMRFPGGVFTNKIKAYTDVVTEHGYRYINWSAETGDADRNLEPVEYLINHVKHDIRGQNNVVILMHDAPAKTTTVQALPTIIQYLKEQGYTFGVFR